MHEKDTSEDDNFSPVSSPEHSIQAPEGSFRSEEVSPARRGGAGGAGRRSRSEVGRGWGGWQQGQGARWRSSSRGDRGQERDRREGIERENQILLRKILDCHQGVDRERTSAIPVRTATKQITGGIKG